MEPKNVFFDHFWAKIMIFTYFDRALEARARRRNFWYFFVIENDAKGRLIPNFRFPAQATTPELRCFCMDLRKKFHLWFLKNIGKISSKFPCFSWKLKFFWFSVLKMGLYRSGEAPNVFEVVHQVWVLSKANSMKKQFWISDLPIFFYGALKIAIFEIFWQKFVSCSKMWQKFLSEISVEISVSWAPTQYFSIQVLEWSEIPGLSYRTI